MKADYDNFWKTAIYKYPRHFLEFFFPDIAADIDWSLAAVEQETELRALLPDAGKGRRTVDALLQVTRISADTGLVHIEVQSQQDPHFEERIFLYFSRLRDKKGRPVCSLAILGDLSNKWRPKALSLDLWGCNLQFNFPTAKLLDYPDTPEQPLNPFSWLVAAHRQAQRTRGNLGQRVEAKLCLVKGLYEHGFSPEAVRELFNLMDWILVLRGKFEYDFTKSLAEFEEARKMVYINSVERYHRKVGREEGRQEGREEGLQEGRQEGLQEGLVAIRQAIATVLKSRWDVAAPDKLQALGDTTSLQAALQLALDSKSYQEFLQLLGKP